MINLLKSTQNKNKKLVALIDGEHYPKINLDSLKLLKKYYKGAVSGIIFLGGTEKLTENNLDEYYGLEVFSIKDIDRDFIEALDVFKPDLVYDLSDEPVVNHSIRMKIASFCFYRQCSYMGPDFYFEYEPKEITASGPSLMIIGTGKRVGKTAVSSYFARLLSGKNKVCIVAMGRGGPQKPEVLRGGDIEINPQFLLDISRGGMHASSDYIEDALFSQVDTVGCRRCGGGFGGKFFLSNLKEGVKAAERLDPEIIIIEGSGASVPAVDSDYNVCVVGADQHWDSIVGYLGIYRIMMSDMVFMTMCESPSASHENIIFLENQIRKIKPGIKIVKSVFRPEPIYGIKDKKVFVFSTARSDIGKTIKEYLEKQYNCEVVKISFNLSDRSKLAEDLKQEKDYDTLLTELKAASVDIITEFAYSSGKEINYLNNVPIIIEGEKDFNESIEKIRSLK